MLLKDGVSLQQLSDSKEKAVLENDIVTVERLLVNEIGDFEDLSHTDADVIYSVSGYVTSAVNCDCFVPPVIEEDVSHFEAMSRGGWTVPQPSILFLCTVATAAFNAFTKNDKREVFLSIKNHRSAFVAALKSMLFNRIPSLIKCPHVARVLSTYFNCLSKNFLRNENNIYDHGSFRKIRKLLSRCCK